MKLRDDHTSSGNERDPEVVAAEVRPVQAAMSEVWTAAITANEQHAYNDGVRAATPEKSAEDAGFERGWKNGYESAFQQVMGHVGSPARRIDDAEIPVS